MNHRKSASRTGGLSPDKPGYGGLSPDAIPRGEQDEDGGGEVSPGKKGLRASGGLRQSFSSSTKKKSTRRSVIMEEEEGEDYPQGSSQRMGEPNSVDQGTSSPGKRAAQPLAEKPSDSFRASRGAPAQSSA